MTATSPLRAAFASLRKFNPKGNRLERPESDAAGGLLAAVLADQALRFSTVLDLLASHGSTVKPGKMEREVLAAVRLGALSWLRGVPPHAAVSEAVALLPAGHRARGLVNAVLRRIVETFARRELSIEEGASLRGVSPALSTDKSLPVGNRWLIESQYPAFPAGEQDRWMLIGGLPAWLGPALLESLDERELAQVCLSCAETPAVWFRVTTKDPELGGRTLTDLGATGPCAPLSAGSAAHATGEAVPKILASAAFRSGALTVQDFAAQLVVALSPVPVGARCLDLCSAPGGKTVQLAERTGPSGHVVAADVSPDRLNLVRENVRRLGLGNVNGLVLDATTGTAPSCGEFDLVLADVPCSNTGVMARRVEVRHRIRPQDLTELHPIQSAILVNAARHARPGGLVIYSTCSLLDSENGALVRAFLDAQGGEDSGWQLVDELLTLPVPGLHDGGYFAVLRRPEKGPEILPLPCANVSATPLLAGKAPPQPRRKHRRPGRKPGRGRDSDQSSRPRAGSQAS